MEITVKDRWLGAMCYAAFLVVVPMMATERSPFVDRHCRQVFALLFVEVVGALFLLIIQHTIGRIWLVGGLVTIVLKLAVYLVFLALSVMGFTRALFGEYWRIPYLDDLAGRIPFGR